MRIYLPLLQRRRKGIKNRIILISLETGAEPQVSASHLALGRPTRKRQLRREEAGSTPTDTLHQALTLMQIPRTVKYCWLREN